MDVVSKKRRSQMMASIKGRDTKPERVMRSALHRIGFRYRLHAQRLPGKPDIVLTKYKAAIFVNGCFWHRHPYCKYAYVPKSHRSFWRRKFLENTNHDQAVHRQLEKLGWRVFVVWECQTTRAAVMAERIGRTIRKTHKRHHP